MIEPTIGGVLSAVRTLWVCRQMLQSCSTVCPQLIASCIPCMDASAQQLGSHAARLTGVSCPLQVDAEMPVAIFAENKEHALAVGLTKMSTKDIREINKDIGVENVHYLNDGLWKNNTFV